jgi:hypothetical protein
MSLRRTYAWCVGLLATFAVSAYATAAGESGIAAVAVPAVAIAWTLSSRGGPGKGFRFPRWVVNLMLAGAVFYALARSARGFEVANVALLAIMLLVIKVLDRRAPRDDAQVMALSVFLAIAAMLDSNRLSVGIQLVVLVPLLVASVMTFQLHPAWWESSEPRASDRTLRPSLKRTIAGGSVSVVLAAIVIFLIMPRGLGQNAFGSWGQPLGGSVTGFTDTVSLGRRNVISTSTEVVMDVQFRQGTFGEIDQAPIAGSDDEVFYLRGAVLDEYQDGRWTSARAPQVSGRASRTEVERGELAPINRAQPLADVRGPVLEQTCTFRGNAARDALIPVFNVWRPLSTETDQPTGRIVDLSRLVISFHRHESGPVQYKVVSALAEEDGEPRPSYRVARLDNERITTLTREIVTAARQSMDPQDRGPSEDAAVCRAIMNWLRARCTYTLEEPPVPSGVDPIEHFLFTSHRGHCEYFASAMAAMCRAAAIHARVVTGYVAAEWNPSSQSYIVRQSNAHAWVEAGRDRWRRFDPTPPADLVRIHRPAATILSRFWRALDTIEYVWNKSVVSFDEGSRRSIVGVGRLGDWQSRWMASVMNWMQSRRSARGATGRLVREILSVVVPLAVLILAGSWIKKRWSMKRARRATSVASPAMERLYQDSLRVLRRAGEEKPSWKPPIAHAHTLARPDMALVLHEISDTYYRDRFGGKGPEASEIRALRTRLRSLRS